MKTRKLTLFTLTLLATLLIGAIAVNVYAPKKKKLKVKWNPPSYLMDDNPPDPWKAEVWFAPPDDLTKINTATIQLEGGYIPESPPYMHLAKPRLVVPFDGIEVMTALLLKVGHMTPGGEYRVYLEITGEMNDGTPFTGEGGINLLVPDTPPP